MRLGNEEACPKLTNFINVLQPRQQKAVWTALAELLKGLAAAGNVFFENFLSPKLFL